MFSMLINRQDRSSFLAPESRDTDQILFPTVTEAKRLTRQDFGLHQATEAAVAGGASVTADAATSNSIDYDMMIAQTTANTVEHDLLQAFKKFNVQVGQNMEITITPPGAHRAGYRRESDSIEIKKPIMFESIQLENGEIKLKLNIDGSSKTITISQNKGWDNVGNVFQIQSPYFYSTVKPWLQSWDKGLIVGSNQLAVKWELQDSGKVIVSQSGGYDPYIAPGIVFVFK
jgi:hypothetical protein